MGNFAEGIKNGIATINDWSSDGFKPVSPEVAQSRADICRRGDNGSACRFNQDPPIKVPDSIAAIIKSHVDKKNGMKLTVDGESELHICTVCACILPLKIYVPMDTIRSQMNDVQSEKFKTDAPWCWMNKP